MARRCGAKQCANHRRAGPILLLQMPKNGTPLWREAHLQGKMYKTLHARTNFGRSDVQKWHAAVARSAFSIQNAQNTTIADQFWKFRSAKIARHCGETYICKSKCGKKTGTDHFLKIRCQKIAHRCGPKHICKSKCTKHPRFAAF